MVPLREDHLAEFSQELDELGFEKVSFGKTFRRSVNGTDVSSQLDWLMVTAQVKVSNTRKLESGMSDHDLILWDLKTQKETGKAVRKFRNMKKIDKVNFAGDLAQQPWENIAYMSSVDEMAQELNNRVLAVLDQHAPLQEAKCKKKWMPKPSTELVKLRRKRDNAQSKGKADKLRRLRAQCKSLARKENLQYTSQRLEKNSGAAWNIVQEMTGS